jgi:hypothetical protein
MKRVEELLDYEDVSDALLQLAHREPAVAARLASNILSAHAGDVYLRAFAVNMLYLTDRTQAFAYIRQNAATSEARVFWEMLQEVADDIGLLEASPELQEMVRFLRSVVAVRQTAIGDDEPVMRTLFLPGDS